MRQKRKKKEFKDLLLPILLVLAVLPFITRLITYDAGLSEYSWYSAYDILTDFFSYYRSYVFILIAIASGIILIPYFLLNRGKNKDMKPFILIGIYLFFVLLSTIVSVNHKFSTLGGPEHFESVFVLLGYVVMLIYTYQIDKKEEDYKSILKALFFSFFVMCIIGFFQLIGKDLLYNIFVQKMIIPGEYWKDYLGKLHSQLKTNAISLTLFNPNFASVYLAMIIPFLIAIILPPAGNRKSQGTTDEINKKERIISLIFLVLFMVFLFRTYSRAGLIAAVMGVLFIGYFNRALLYKHWKKCCIIVTVAVLAFVSIDFANEFRFLHKITGTVQSFQDVEKSSLDEIITSQSGVSIRYNNELITVALSKDADDKDILVFKNAAGESITGSYDKKAEILNWAPYQNIKFYLEEVKNVPYIFCEINDIIWRFYKDSKNGYVYLNDFGKPDHLTKVARVGSKSMEDIGSGRGYIWSRTIPLLRNTILFGTGPDTFPLVFPQSDYVGKANNCKTPYTLIEKPHNLYLMIGIQTGVLSLIAFLAFYLIYLIRSITIYKNSDLSSLKVRMGLGCLAATLSFMISGLFNDSSLQTTPVFIILLGLGMDINDQIRKTGKLQQI